jgi:hypothetical protein
MPGNMEAGVDRLHHERRYIPKTDRHCERSERARRSRFSSVAYWPAGCFHKRSDERFHLLRTADCEPDWSLFSPELKLEFQERAALSFGDNPRRQLRDKVVFLSGKTKGVAVFQFAHFFAFGKNYRDVSDAVRKLVG